MSLAHPAARVRAPHPTRAADRAFAGLGPRAPRAGSPPAALGALALGLVAGCATAEAPSMGAAIAASGVGPAPRPAAYAVAIAPLAIDPAAALSPQSAADAWSPIPCDAERLRVALTEAAMASGAFDRKRTSFLDALADHERVGAVGGAGAGGAGAGLAAASASPTSTPSGAPAFAVPVAPAPEVVLDAAHATRVDLVLGLRVRRHAARYVERNGWFIPNLVLFATWVWPAWFVADERYAAELEVEATLRAVGSERAVWTKTYRAAPVVDLDHLDRGWKLFGHVTVPGSLTLDNYARAGERAMPYAVNEVGAALARDLVALRAEMDGAAFKGLLAHTQAVVAGVGRYRKIREPRHATDDALGFAARLGEHARLPARNLTVLTEAAPTKAALLAALADRAQRAGPNDTLLVYFSGYGFEHGGALYLAPHDLDPARPVASALPLAEVARVLGRSRARQVVILDTSFAEGGEERLRTVPRALLPGLAGADPAAPAGGGERIEAALAAFAQGRIVLTGTAPGSAATEDSPVPEDKKGLFTARLLDALGSASTDKDRDGSITVLEAFDAAQRDTRRLAGQFGLAQVPALFPGGPDPAKVRLVLAPKG